MHVVDRLVLTLLTFGRKVEPQEAILAAKMRLFSHVLLRSEESQLESKNNLHNLSAKKMENK